MRGVKKIETTLIEGAPNGLKRIRVIPSVIDAFVIPKDKVSDASKIADIDRHGVYFLLDSSKTKIYVGQTTNGIHRIEDHCRSKRFWDVAVLFLADNKTFSLDTISGLEKYAIVESQKTGLYDVQNTVTPKYVIDPFDLATIENFYAEIKLLMSCSGYPLEKETASTVAETVYTTVRKTAKGRLAVRDGKYVVLKGSVLSASIFPSCPPAVARLRSDMVTKGSLKATSTGYELAIDVSFDSPSSAAAFVYGASANGWTEWMDSKGVTINELIRNKK